MLDPAIRPRVTMRTRRREGYLNSTNAHTETVSSLVDARSMHDATSKQRASTSPGTQANRTERRLDETAREDNCGKAHEVSEVQILGQRIAIRTDVPADELNRIVAFVNQKAEELSFSTPMSGNKLLALTALNLAQLYFQESERNERLRREVMQQSRAILTELDRFTATTSSSMGPDR